MADLSEVKRSNFNVLRNNSRTAWASVLKFIGMVDIGQEMNPIDFGDYPIQSGRLIGGQKVKFRYFA